MVSTRENQVCATSIVSGSPAGGPETQTPFTTTREAKHTHELNAGRKIRALQEQSQDTPSFNRTTNKSELLELLTVRATTDNSWSSRYTPERGCRFHTRTPRTHTPG